MTKKQIDNCPHCGQRLLRWATPPDSSWSGAVHKVCFNDDCPYYQRGWKWMEERYEQHASYRYRFDPDTGAEGPLPVWSPQAHRNWIVKEDDQETESP